MKFPKSREIKIKAIEFSKNKNVFKASKGWYDKFIIRNYQESLMNPEIKEKILIIKRKRLLKRANNL